MNDFLRSYFPIDLLIGLDYANEIRLGEIIRCDGLEARMSILGPYIEGCITNKDHIHNGEQAYDHTLMTLSSSVPDDDLIDLIQQQDNVIQEQLDRAFNYDDYTTESRTGGGYSRGHRVPDYKEGT